MIKDRGNKKWVSLMLTEHRKGLKKLKEAEERITKPELAADKKQELNQIFQEVQNKKQAVKVVFFSDGQTHQIVGQIKEYSLQKKEILISCKQKSDKKLKVEDILDLKKYPPNAKSPV